MIKTFAPTADFRKFLQIDCLIYEDLSFLAIMTASKMIKRLYFKFCDVCIKYPITFSNFREAYLWLNSAGTKPSWTVLKSFLKTGKSFISLKSCFSQTWSSRISKWGYKMDYWYFLTWPLLIVFSVRNFDLFCGFHSLQLWIFL